MRWGELASRFDCFYHGLEHKHNEELLKRTPYDLVKLDDICIQITDGTHYTPTYFESGVHFISVVNIAESKIDFDETKFISIEEHETFIKRCFPKARDILLTKIGSIGRAAIVPENSPDFSIFVSVALLKLDIKKVLPEFLLAFLNSKLAYYQFERHLKGIGVPDLHLENIATTLIPLPSDIEKQEQLSNIYMNGIRQNHENLKKVDNLLSGMDTFVLNILGIVPEQKKDKPFAMKISQLEQRIDADYYTASFRSLRKKILNCDYPAIHIKDAYEYMKTGFAAGKQDQVDIDDETGVIQIRPFNISSDGMLVFDTTKHVPESNMSDDKYCLKGEVLFNNTNSAKWVGKSTVFDTDISCTASNHITRIKFIDSINPYYVACLFNAFCNLGYWDLLSTYFNNQAGVNSVTLDAVVIPIPPIEIQERIANEMNRRFTEANRLKKEADEEWQAARKEFEEKLLGGIES